jgi:hypothetical protein
MADIECSRCGARVTSGSVCPVCETPYGEASRPRNDAVDAPGEEAALARWWRSGQLAVAMAAGWYALAIVLPVMSGVGLREGSEVRLDVSVRPLDLALGTFPALRGQMTAWFLPGAVLFLLQLLRSRRTGSAMGSSRPLLAVMALGPLVSVAMPLLRLRKQGMSPTPGIALIAVLVGATLCGFAALRFGNGVAEAAPRSRKPVEADD